METLFTILATIVVYNLFLFALYKRAKRKQEQLIKEIRETASEVMEEMTRSVYVEKVEGQWLSYDAKTNQFLTKFSNLHDLSKSLIKLDDSAIWMITQDSLTTYMQEQNNERQKVNAV